MGSIEIVIEQSLEVTVTKCVVRWLIAVNTGDRKDVFLLPADKDTIDFEFPIAEGTEYDMEAIGLDSTAGDILCRDLANYKTGIFYLEEIFYRATDHYNY